MNKDSSVEILPRRDNVLKFSKIKLEKDKEKLIIEQEISIEPVIKEEFIDEKSNEKQSTI